MLIRIKVFKPVNFIFGGSLPCCTAEPGRSDLIFASFVQNFGQMIRDFPSAYNM